MLAKSFSNLAIFNISFNRHLFALCLLLLYITSLFFDTLLGQVFFTFSLSSIIAFLFGSYFLFLYSRGYYRFYLSIPLAISFILFAILAFSELFIHHSSIINHYFRAYFSNIIFCSLLYGYFCNSFILLKFCLKFLYGCGFLFSLLVCIGLFVDVSGLS